MNNSLSVITELHEDKSVKEWVQVALNILKCSNCCEQNSATPASDSSTSSDRPNLPVPIINLESHEPKQKC